MLIAVGLAARWLISRALQPVIRMTRQASQWSENELDRRFAAGPPHDELTELAATLDRLLERIARSLRHEQRLSAELSHELRTPLASIAAEAQYALRHTEQPEEGKATLQQILASAEQLQRTLDTLMAAARAQLDPHGATSDAAAAALAARTACLHMGEPQVEVLVDSPLQTLRVAVEQGLVERILAPLIENAIRHATRRVQVRITSEDQQVAFLVADDGPGVSTEQHEAIFRPGYRAHAGGGVSTLSPPGAGLGLALARRLARTAGGDVTAQPSDDGGRFVVRLPRA